MHNSIHSLATYGHLWPPILTDRQMLVLLLLLLSGNIYCIVYCIEVFTRRKLHFNIYVSLSAQTAGERR